MEFFKDKIWKSKNIGKIYFFFFFSIPYPSLKKIFPPFIFLKLFMILEKKKKHVLWRIETKTIQHTQDLETVVKHGQVKMEVAIVQAKLFLEEARRRRGMQVKSPTGGTSALYHLLRPGEGANQLRRLEVG